MKKVEDLTITPVKPIAKKWLCYLIALGYVVQLALLVVSTIFVISGKTWALGGYVIAIALFVYGFYASKHFAWNNSIDFKQEGSAIKVICHGCLGHGMLGEDKTTYEVVRFDNLKFIGNDAIIYGMIEVRESFSKPKVIKKVRIPAITQEAKAWLSSYEK